MLDSNKIQRVATLYNMDGVEILSAMDDSNNCLHTVHKLLTAVTFDYAIVGDILTTSLKKTRIDPQYKGNAFIYFFVGLLVIYCFIQFVKTIQIENVQSTIEY